MTEENMIKLSIAESLKNHGPPLRLKTLPKKRPIVILSNGILGDETISRDTFLWSEINIFKEIYIIKGIALNPSDLERARVSKAKSIIILSK